MEQDPTCRSPKRRVHSRRRWTLSTRKHKENAITEATNHDRDTVVTLKMTHGWEVWGAREGGPLLISTLTLGQDQTEDRDSSPNLIRGTTQPEQTCCFFCENGY